jgi:hypothetical protein
MTQRAINPTVPVTDGVVVQQTNSPGDPASNEAKIYVRTNGDAYVRYSNGSERQVTLGSTSGGGSQGGGGAI